MKDIKNYINESKNSWEYFKTVYDPSPGLKLPGLENDKVKWLHINTEGATLAGITEDDIDAWKDDFDDDYMGNKVKKLKIGDSYDADGGINIYVRIKK